MPIAPNRSSGRDGYPGMSGNNRFTAQPQFPVLVKNIKMPSLKKKYFPLADKPSDAELAELGVQDEVGVLATPTGERRAPRQGEWYLSGAVVEGYRAPNDLSTPYHIAKLVVL